MRTRFFPPLGLILLTLSTAAPSAGAQTAGRGGPDSSTRARLGVSYLRVDHAYRAHPPSSPAESGPFNQAFDRGTLLFFGGKYEEAIALLDSLAVALDPSPAAQRRYAEQVTGNMERWQAQRRFVVIGQDTIPYHLVAPTGRQGPRPLVIALHGAGADERAFVEGYGAGRLRELAEEQGFLLVAPFTNAFMRHPGEAFDQLVDVVRASHAVDASRIYVMGHSLGAGASWSVGRLRRERIAAVACLAGGCGAPPTTGPGPSGVPPTLLYAAELDPLAAPQRLETAVARGREAGYTLDFRIAPGVGHTLMVGGVLDEVVGWLLRHHLP
jgi:predicted esterase